VLRARVSLFARLTDNDSLGSITPVLQAINGHAVLIDLKLIKKKDSYVS